MRSLRRGRVGMLAAGSLVLTGLGAAGAAAATPAITFAVDDASAWVTQAYDVVTYADLTPQQADVTGPHRTPYGTGSHQVTIGAEPTRTELYRTPEYDGTKLADLTRLEYSTFAKRTAGTGDPRQSSYLRLNVDNDADGQQDASLFFFPANNADQHALANGVWQDWDVVGGKVNVNGDDGPTNAVSLATYATEHPASTLVNNDSNKPSGGALAIITGGADGGDTDPFVNGTYDIDRVVVGTAATETLFDFGPDAETSGATAAHVVDPEHLAGWAHQAFDDVDYLTSDQSFVSGPGTAPAGVGSLRFSISTAENAGRVELFRTTRYDGTLLRDLRTATFSTFQRGNAGNTVDQQPVYLRLSLDDNGDGSRDHTLFFFPGNNAAAQGAVQQGAWQDWSAADGKWNVDGDAGPQAAISLQDYVVQHPDATIVANADAGAPDQPKGGVAFIAGGAGATQSDGEYFLDDVTIRTADAATGTTVSGHRFDLEPTAPVVSVGDVSVREGNKSATLRFPVTLDHAAGYPVTVAFGTEDGSALSGKDYVASTGTVTVPAGKTSATIAVKVLSDKVRERDETVELTIGNPSYGTLGDATATGTIVNDDTRVTISLAPATRHRVKAHVETLPAAPGDTVKVFRVTAKGRTLVLSTDLNRFGRITRVLGKHYAPGTKVRFFATVRTDAGLYTSRTARITVRR